MRKDCHIDPSRWIREYRQALKLGNVAFKVLLYCETGPESHRTGLFYVAAATVAAAVNDETEHVETAFDDLERIGLLMRDADAGLVYLPGQAARQYAWKDVPKPSDYRVIEARRHVASLPASHLVDLLIDACPIFRTDQAPSAFSNQNAEAPSAFSNQNAEAPSAVRNKNRQGTTTSTFAEGTGSPTPEGAPDAPEPIRLEGAA